MHTKNRNTKNLRVDRLTNLPDSIIHQILSFLSDTKQVVRTSILSKKWKSHWKSVHNLDFNSNSFHHPYFFSNFVLSVMNQREEGFPLEKLSFQTRSFACNNSLIETVINYVVTHQTKHFFFRSPREYHIPQNLLSCESLTTLHFQNMILMSYSNLSSGVVLPSLKTMHIEDCIFEYIFGDLFSSCPNLITLNLIRCRPLACEPLKLSGSRLEKLEISLALDIEVPTQWKIEIFAPNLRYFTYSNRISADVYFLGSTLENLEHADINFFNPCRHFIFVDKGGEGLFKSGRLFKFEKRVHHVYCILVHPSLISFLDSSGAYRKDDCPSLPFRRLKSLKLQISQFGENGVLSRYVLDYFLGAYLESSDAKTRD